MVILQQHLAGVEDLEAAFDGASAVVVVEVEAHAAAVAANVVQDAEEAHQVPVHGVEEVLLADELAEDEAAQRDLVRVGTKLGLEQQRPVGEDHD